MPNDFDQRVRALFDQALERSEEERTQYIKEACQGDQTLFQAVDRLIEARKASNSFLNSAAMPANFIGRYYVQGELGRGGMGIVYDAIDPIIGRNVAVKVINLKAITEPGQAEFMRERLFREARSCGRLSHPGIVIIFDVGEEQESAFIAMEKIDGPSLQQHLASNKRGMAATEVLRILQEAASALDYAHRNGTVHRDIKPANIMLRSDGAVKITDFGIAKIISGQRSTMTGVVMGTPSYMSPEQVEGGKVDGCSDQFSLAILGYEMLTGQKPFQGDSLPSIAHAIVYGQRPSPRAVNPTLPATLDPVFQRVFSKLPSDRFANCSDFAAALQAAFVTPAPPSRPQGVPGAITEGAKPPRSPWVTYLLVAAAIFVIGAAGLYFYAQRGGTPAPAAEHRAEVQTQAPPASMPAARTVSEPDTTPQGPASPFSLKVGVTAPPVVKQFRADPDNVKTGSPAMLIWEVSGAEKVTIDHGVGKVAAKGMFAVVPAVSTTYTLTATDQAGTIHKAAAVEVEPDPESVPRSVRARQLFTEAAKKRQDGQAEEAAALFSRAAEMGDNGAMLEIGEMYNSGDGVTQDEGKALGWFKKAAEAGNAAGMVALAGMYLLGANGADPNEEEAARWFQKAADQDNPAALYDLGSLYESGRGVTRNLEKAKELYERAAKLGNRQAEKRLGQLGRR